MAIIQKLRKGLFDYPRHRDNLCRGVRFIDNLGQAPFRGFCDLLWSLGYYLNKLR
jgi:hypothetical protein